LLKGQRILVTRVALHPEECENLLASRPESGPAFGTKRTSAAAVKRESGYVESRDGEGRSAPMTSNGP
jgi:hypothetical protein